MQRRTFLSLFAGLLTSQVALAGRLRFARVERNDSENELYLVRTICIGKVEGLRQDDHFLAELTDELEKKSFIVTKDLKSADAVLTGVIEMVVVLDGNGTNIPDDTLRFQLTSCSKDRIWSAKIQMRGQSTAEKDDKYKAQRLAEKIWRDWNNSAKKAAGKSGSRATSK